MIILKNIKSSHVGYNKFQKYPEGKKLRNDPEFREFDENARNKNSEIKKNFESRPGIPGDFFGIFLGFLYPDTQNFGTLHSSFFFGFFNPGSGFSIRIPENLGIPEFLDLAQT